MNSQLTSQTKANCAKPAAAAAALSFSTSADAKRGSITYSFSKGRQNFGGVILV